MRKVGCQRLNEAVREVGRRRSEDEARQVGCRRSDEEVREVEAQARSNGMIGYLSIYLSLTYVSVVTGTNGEAERCCE